MKINEALFAQAFCNPLELLDLCAYTGSASASDCPPSADLDQPLAGILAAIKTGDRSRRLFDAFQHVFGIAQSSIANPLGQARKGLFEPRRVVEDDESLHACTLDQQVTLGPRASGPGIPARDRRGSANDHARADGEVAKNRVADLSTGIVEIDIDTSWAGCRECGCQIVALVVDRRIVAEQLAALGDLRGPARNTDGPATGDFRDLTDRRAHRAGRRRHHYSIAGAWLANIQQPKIGGHA